MKKIVMAFVTMCLCMTAFAVSADAESLADRFDPGLPPGMVAKVDRGSDYVDILIDTHATDWDMVATAARKSESLVIHPGIHAPQNVLGAAFSTDISRRNGESQAAAEERVLNDMIKNAGYGDNNSVYECSYQGWMIGSYDGGTGLFLPMPIGQGWASFAVGWRMPDGDLNVECVRFNVRFTDLVPIYTKRIGVKAGDIVPFFRLNEWSLLHGDAAPAEGSVVYEIDNVSPGKEAYVCTAIAAPYDADWTAAYLLSNGKEQRESGDSLTTVWTPRTEGHPTGKPYIIPYFRVERSDILEKKDWVIKWVRKGDDGEDVVVVTGLEAVFKVGKPQFTASYPYNEKGQPEKAGAMPIPAGRLQFQITDPIEGLNVEKRNGCIHMSVDEDVLPKNRKTDLSRTMMSAAVKVPDRAESFKVYYQRGDVIYGNWNEKQEFRGEVDQAPKGQWMGLQEFTNRPFFKAYNDVLHNGKFMTYYVAAMPYGPYGGETLIFEWTLRNQDGSTTVSREYVSLTMDLYQLKRNPSETMNPNKVEMNGHPIVVTNMKMDVETAMLPQMGENVLRHEITLYDDDGMKLTLDQPVILYLPYPDGKTMEECENDVFVVYHQVGKDNYEEFSLAKGNLTLTKEGLRMQVTSFSPYYINWEAGGQTDSLPMTGDDSRLALWLLLALGTMTLGVGLKKKNAA